MWRWPTSSPRARAASPTISAASSSPPAIGEDDDRRALQGRQRRLFRRSWSTRWPTAWPRPSPRPARTGCARELWGYAPDETLPTARADRREIPRHPPGARLSGPARPHREGDAVRPAGRRGGDRREAHRELRHVARRLGVRPLFQPPRRATISASARSSATRSRTTPAARAGARRRRRSGWRRSSTTTRPPSRAAAE